MARDTSQSWRLAEGENVIWILQSSIQCHDELEVESKPPQCSQARRRGVVVRGPAKTRMVQATKGRFEVVSGL
jgi:hypothetical protein